MSRIFVAVAAFAAMLPLSVTNAQIVNIGAGKTSVLLDTATLASAANLNLFGVSGPVIAPGDLGPDSVAFPILPRNASSPDLPTTFSYDASDFLGTFSGTIEHSGSVLFNGGAVEVGDFTIGFDGARTGSGFFVASTKSIEAILFDVSPTGVDPQADSLTIEADLLVSPEFAGFLQGAGLASTDLTGATVGSAKVFAVPEPNSLAILTVGLVPVLMSRRRRVR